MKKLIALVLTLCLCVGFAAIAGAQGELSGLKIGVLHYKETGEDVEALLAFLDALKAETGLDYTFVCGSSYDEQTNLTQAQNLISSGCNGIVMCMDSAMTSVMEECELAEVYVAGYLCDFETSFDAIKDNPYFLGTICDGEYNNASIGAQAAELALEDGVKNIGIVTFPLRYYPHKAEAIAEFQARIDEYNATAADADKITVFETQELSFEPLDPTYFATYPQVDAIFALASSFVYPVMVSENRTDVKLYSTGFESEESIQDATRQGIMRMQTFANTEAVVYPISLLVNAIQGNTYPDQPATERVDTSVVFVTNAEEMDAVLTKSFYLTADMEDFFYTMDEIRNMIISINPDATYATLTAKLHSMDMEAILAK